MKAKSKFVSTLGGALFWIGLALAFTLATMIVWSQLEARFYGFEQFTREQLRTLHCPVLMTTDDTAAVRATFKNGLDRPIELTVSAQITAKGFPVTERVTLSMAPGEKVRHEWMVSARNVVMGRFIFARVVQLPTFGQQLRESTCGIMVLPIKGLTGQQVFVMVILGSLLGIVVGSILWQQFPRPLMGPISSAAVMRLLSLIALGALLSSLLGWWMIGIVFLIASFILIVTLASYALVK